MAVTSPADGSCPESILALTCWRRYIIIVTLFQMQVDLFDNELSLLVLLTVFVCPGIRPSNHFLTPLAKDIIDTVKASHQEPIFHGTNSYVHTVVKEVGTSVTSMKTLRNDLIVTCQMGSTLGTRVNLGSI